MKIAIDAMGGDYAPEEIVKGAVEAAKEYDAEIILVGNSSLIKEHLGDRELKNISIVHCDQYIAMDEKPAVALRKKKDASIAVATRLVKEGRADAVISAGSTGAQMASSLITLGRLKNVQRPAIAAILPGLKGNIVLLDAGANTDCRPENLVEFAVMGSVYAEKVLGISKPKVGLLNIGTEPTKGDLLTREAYQLLQKVPINFYGNIEARDILTGNVDVVVCDGFVGNSLLKFGEGIGKIFYSLLQDAVKSSFLTKLGGFLLLSSFKEIKRKLDWQEYGGAPLLGIKGISIICHGSSKSTAVKNAVRVAIKCIKDDFVKVLSDFLETGYVSDKEKVKLCHRH
ncbi:MAG TPA: phosphate acyltransferase PlsX [Peptococcaceae bacterium]|nr:MAG: Phosphate acyltransferase [Clostridia bacterium 41_269]HBT20031.1 phosphate acyltransferase PlsX [Peptococcaceae bacterium]